MFLALFSALISIAEGLEMCTEKQAFTPRSDSYEFTLIDLPYSYDYLEPVLSMDIMTAHHDRHHQKYVDKLNLSIQGNSDYESLTLVGLQSLAKTQIAITRYGGGDYNHRMYWWVMTSPYCSHGFPSGGLLGQIEADFGSFDDFKTQFEDTSLALFGSGWVWACVNSHGSIEIRETQNQINPLMEITGDLCYPFFAIDIWEHAYYLEYKWDRAAYLTNYWDIVDWDVVGMFFEDYASQGVAVPLG